MKWPMPRDGKSSPSFHAVRPATVPLHSFCQIFFPIRSASAWDRAMTARACAGTGGHDTREGKGSDQSECGLSVSLTGEVYPLAWQFPAAVELKDRTGKFHSYETFHDHCSRTHPVALTASGENKPSQLKDLKDKVSYSIGLDLGSISRNRIWNSIPTLSLPA